MSRRPHSLVLAISLACLVLSGCSSVSREQALCTAAMQVASATTNMLDAMTAISRSQREQYLTAVAIAKADLAAVPAALDQAQAAQGGAGEADQSIRSVLAAAGAMLNEVDGASSTDASVLRARIAAVQQSLEDIPGLRAGCTEPIKPPIESP